MLKVSGYSDKGGREYNEDNCAAIKRGRMFVAVLADGLGGHGGGDIASRTAVELVRDGMDDLSGHPEQAKEILTQWFSDANEEILRRQTGAQQMKTTLTMLYIDEQAHACAGAHLGDSRIYHFVNGRYVYCTFDHSVSRMAVLSGEITMDEIRHHQDRNRLLKVVGMEEAFSPEWDQFEVNDNAAHAFLLCSDGFWEYVTEQEMEGELFNSKTPEEWINRMREILESRAAEKGKHNHDNNSAVAVWYKG